VENDAIRKNVTTLEKEKAHRDVSWTAPAKACKGCQRKQLRPKGEEGGSSKPKAQKNNARTLEKKAFASKE